MFVTAYKKVYSYNFAWITLPFKSQLHNENIIESARLQYETVQYYYFQRHKVVCDSFPLYQKRWLNTEPNETCIKALAVSRNENSNALASIKFFSFYAFSVAPFSIQYQFESTSINKYTCG